MDSEELMTHILAAVLLWMMGLGIGWMIEENDTVLLLFGMPIVLTIVLGIGILYYEYLKDLYPRPGNTCRKQRDPITIVPSASEIRVYGGVYNTEGAIHLTAVEVNNLCDALPIKEGEETVL